MRHLLVLFVLAAGLLPAWALTVEQEAELLASDGAAGDFFGRAVAVFGDTAIVGARDADAGGPESGSAYVFMRVGSTWLESVKLLPADGEAGDNFGSSVALDGDTAIIGAHEWDNDGPGSVYVFTRVGCGWTESSKLLPDDANAGDRFGGSVSLDGDTVLIGADADVGLAGSAYVFVRTGGAWVQQAKLVASDGASQDSFGLSVAIDGDTAVIGAWLDDDNGPGSGSAYVFTRSAGVWTERAKLLASDGAALDFFGKRVALDGDTALIGAHEVDYVGTETGAAYVFTGSGGAWTEQAKLFASDPAPGHNFGVSIALHGDTALIGANGHDDDGLNPGAAYLFKQDAGVWTEQAKLLAADGADGDLFGVSVALDGETYLVGADQDGAGTGMAYVFREPGVGTPATGVVGNVLLLVLLGGGGYFLRRRSS